MKYLIITLLMVFNAINSFGQITQYTKPVESNTEEYVSSTPSLGLLMLAGVAKQQAEIRKMQVQINSFLEYYKSITHFKDAANGKHDAKALFNNEFISDCIVYTVDNKIFEIDLGEKIYKDVNGLKVNSDVVNGHTKLFLDHDGRYIKIDAFLLDTFQ